MSRQRKRVADRVDLRRGHGRRAAAEQTQRAQVVALEIQGSASSDAYTVGTA